MKRWILLAIVLALLGTSSRRGVDIGELSPVETVWLAQQASGVFIQTDTGEKGQGNDVLQAVENMKATASGAIFLETADYLIVRVGDENLLAQAAQLIRPSCMLCASEQLPDLQQATEFLSVQERLMTLRQWQVEGGKLPRLQVNEERFEWYDG